MRYLILLTFFILVLTSYSQNNNCAIKIIVKKKQTNEAISDSLFISLSKEGTTNYKVISNNDGETMIKHLEPGKYKISISVKGYLPQEIKKIIIGEDKTAYLTFDLTTNEEVKNNSRKRGKK